MVRPALDYLILDAVADDAESLGQIRDLIADASTSESNLISALRRLVQDQLVEAYTIPSDETVLVSAGEGIWPPAAADDLWFQITKRGRMVHQAWANDAGGAA